jgi:hypothetical protein
MNPNVVTAIIAGAFGLIGAIVGVCGALFIAARTARIDEQRHLRELGMKDRQHFRELGLQVAHTKFKKEQEMAQKIADLTGEIRSTPPFSVFVVDGIKMMEIVSDSRLSADEVGVRLAALNDFNESVIKEIRAKNKFNA